MVAVDSEDRAERIRAAADVYVYGYPLVYWLTETAGFAVGESNLPVGAPCNEFGYAPELLGAADNVRVLEQRHAVRPRRAE